MYSIVYFIIFHKCLYLYITFLWNIISYILQRKNFKKFSSICLFCNAIYKRFFHFKMTTFQLFSRNILATYKTNTRYTLIEEYSLAKADISFHFVYFCKFYNFYFDLFLYSNCNHKSLKIFSHKIQPFTLWSCLIIETLPTLFNNF